VAQVMENNRERSGGDLSLAYKDRMDVFYSVPTQACPRGGQPHRTFPTYSGSGAAWQIAKTDHGAESLNRFKRRGQWRLRRITSNRAACSLAFLRPSPPRFAMLIEPVCARPTRLFQPPRQWA